MNTPLDNATVFRISGLLFLMMSFITWIVLGRPRRGSALVWCTGGVLVGLSLGLIGLRGDIPQIWSYGAAQLLLLASFLVIAQSLRMDVQRAWHWRWLLALLLVYGVVMVFGFEDKQSMALAVLVRLSNSAGLLALTVSALALLRQERSRNVRFMAVGYGLMTVCMLLTAVATALGQSTLYDMRVGLFNTILGWVSLLTMLLSNMGYLGLALERSLRTNMALRQAQWQAQQWRERSQALSLLDRQRTLSMLANSLGHGIVQPLTATLLNVQMARRMVLTRAPDAASVRQMLASTVEGLRRSASLIEGIRNFLRSVSGNASTLALQAVVQDAENLLRQELMYRKVALQVSMPSAAVYVRAEPLTLTQALVQVLRNALQAVQDRPQRRISLSLQSDDREAWIEVTDSGSGFPASMEVTGKTGASPVRDGQSGLGLYMAQGILHQAGGSLVLDNTPAGGAYVRLSLPLDTASVG